MVFDVAIRVDASQIVPCMYPATPPKLASDSTNSDSTKPITTSTFSIVFRLPPSATTNAPTTPPLPFPLRVLRLSFFTFS